MILLNNSTLLARGSERECHLYPNDNTKIIKIVYNQKGLNNQNTLEYKYYHFLEKRCIDFSHISRCFGWVNTNLGKGLVFQRIQNFDTTESLSLRSCIVNKMFTDSIEKELLNDLKNYLEKESILFIDATSVNVLVQHIASDAYKLVIIDGLGAKRDGIKFFLYLYFPFYRKYKIKKQWDVFLANIARVKEKIRLNQQL